MDNGDTAILHHNQTSNLFKSNMACRFYIRECHKFFGYGIGIWVGMVNPGYHFNPIFNPNAEICQTRRFSGKGNFAIS